MTFSSIIYTLISVIVFFIILFLFGRKLKSKNFELDTINSLAYSMVLGGVFFGEDRLLAYALMVIGISIAFYRTWKKKKQA